MNKKLFSREIPYRIDFPKLDDVLLVEDADTKEQEHKSMTLLLIDIDRYKVNSFLARADYILIKLKNHKNIKVFTDETKINVLKTILMMVSNENEYSPYSIPTLYFIREDISKDQNSIVYYFFITIDNNIILENVDFVFSANKNVSNPFLQTSSYKYNDDQAIELATTQFLYEKFYTQTNTGKIQKIFEKNK